MISSRNSICIRQVRQAPVSSGRPSPFGTRLLSLVWAGALIWGGLGPPPAEANEGQTELIRLGVRQDAAPLSFMKDGRWAGYSVDLCSRILDAYEKGLPAGRTVEKEFVPVTAANRFDFLGGGRVDLLCEATTVTVSRMEAHHFSLLTFVSGAGAIKRKKTTLGTLEDLSKRPLGIKVSVVDGTTTKARVEDLLGYAVVFPQPSAQTHEDAFELLRHDEVALYIGDRVILREKLRGRDDRDDYMLSAGFLSYEPYAIAIRHGREDLLQAANATLAGLYRDGGIKPIYELWFGDAKMSDLLRAMFELQKLPE